MKLGKKLLITAAVAIAAGALLIAVWSYCLPRESPAQRKARRLVAELRREPPGRLEWWLIRLGLKRLPGPPRRPKEVIPELVSLGVDAVPALIEGFEGEDLATGWVAREAVIGIGPSAVPLLVRALKDERPSVRLHAVVVLGELGSAAGQAIPVLLEMAITEEDQLVHELAVMSLEKVRSGLFLYSDYGFFGGKEYAYHLYHPYHQVYVIDSSGSMVDRLPWVKTELMIAIWRLAASQDFHVVFYGMSPEGGPAEQLLPATEENKLKAAGFVRRSRAKGQTDPVPALEQAFEVLSGADPRRPGKVIHLVTDGVFPDNEKVLEVIRRLNKGKDVQIYTFLVGARHPVAVKVMKTIAGENGGKYVYVRQEER